MDYAYLAAIFDECGSVMRGSPKRKPHVRFWVRDEGLAEAIVEYLGSGSIDRREHGNQVCIYSREAIERLCNDIRPFSRRAPLVGALQDANYEMHHARAAERAEAWAYFNKRVDRWFAS